MIARQQPDVSVEILKRRAQLLRSVRQFMAARDILEVETPVLSSAANPDPNLESFVTRFHSPSDKGPDTLYLHTSPEFAMKRLLASGSGSIYQVTRVFRDAELGRYHWPEFTMLEWYRTGLDHHGLMDECDALISELGFTRAARDSYAVLFLKYTGLDPHRATGADLAAEAARLGLVTTSSERPLVLDFLFDKQVVPHLGVDGPQFVYDFPACQAALSRIRGGDPPVAERFELFINRLEIANGFHELTDADEQLNRFEAENQSRRRQGRPQIPVDQGLIGAMRRGLPACSGVAMGLDRLLMVLIGSTSIEEVLSFASEWIK